MLTPQIEEKIKALTIGLKDTVPFPNKHFSFVVLKNRVISVGHNDYRKTHPTGKKLGYFDSSRHSELDAFIRMRNKNIINKCWLINTRVNSLGIIGMSRPCNCCGPFCVELGFKRIYYTNRAGKFERFL